VCRDIVDLPFCQWSAAALASSPAEARTKTLGDLGDALAIEALFVVAVAIPIDQEVVVCPPRQDVNVNMEHRLPGEFAIGLN
jgi:hypothetical protein